MGLRDAAGLLFFGREATECSGRGSVQTHRGQWAP